MSSTNKSAAELKRVCEATALLTIWRRHRTTQDDSLVAFAEWTLSNPEIVAPELGTEMRNTLASLPNVSDEEKVDFLRIQAVNRAGGTASPFPT